MSNSDFSDYIKENLFNFYNFLGEKTSSSVINTNFYSSIINHDSFWPNMVFNIKNNTAVEIISQQKNKQNIPPFLLIHSSDQIDYNLLEKKNFRILAQWKGMAINIYNTDFSFLETNKLKVLKLKKENFNIWTKIVEKELFNGKKLDENLFKKISASDKIIIYLGYANNKPVATCLTYIDNDIPGYYMISTRKEYQNHGFGSYITLNAVYDSYKTGYKTGILQATKDAYNMYARLGFKNFDYFNIFWKL